MFIKENFDECVSITSIGTRALNMFPNFSFFLVLQSYSKGWKRGVLGPHCSLGTADRKGTYGQGSAQF